jgi:hypothetical protein
VRLLRDLPREFLGQPEEWVGGAVDHIVGDLGEPHAAGPGRSAQEIEGLPGAEPVPFCQHADRLFHADARGQGVLQLLDGDRQTFGSVRFLRDTSRAGNGVVRGVTLLGGEQVSENHRAGQVGYFFLADHPATLALADDKAVIRA